MLRLRRLSVTTHTTAHILHGQVPVISYTLYSCNTKPNQRRSWPLCVFALSISLKVHALFSPFFFFWLPFRFDFGLNKHRARCMSYSEFTWWCPAVKSIPINLWFVCLCASLMGGPLRYALARPSHNYIMPRKVLSARPPNTFCDISGISRSSGFIWRNSLRMKWCSCIRTDTFTIRMMYIYS